MTRLNDVLIHVPSNHTTAKIHTHPCHISKQSKIYELYLFNSVCKICVQIFAHSSFSLIKFSTATEYMQNIQNTKHTLALTCRGKCASQEVTVILLKVFFSLLFSPILDLFVLCVYIEYHHVHSYVCCMLVILFQRKRAESERASGKRKSGSNTTYFTLFALLRELALQCILRSVVACLRLFSIRSVYFSYFSWVVAVVALIYGCCSLQWLQEFRIQSGVSFIWSDVCWLS